MPPFSDISLSSYHSDENKIQCDSSESTIMLRERSQGESSVMRLRLEGCKKHIRGHKTHYEYALVSE